MSIMSLVKKVPCKSLLKKAGKAVVSELPIVCVAGTIVGVVSVAVTMYKKSPKMHDIIEEYQDKVEMLDQELEDNESYTEEMYKDDKRAETGKMLKRLGKEALPVFISLILTFGFVIGGHRANVARQAALAAAWTLSENRIKDLTKATKEVVGDEEFEKIENKVAENKIRESLSEGRPGGYTANAEEAEFVDKDKMVVVDEFGRVFNTTEVAIVQALKDIDLKITYENDADFNDFYASLDLTPTDRGGDYGWNVSEGHTYYTLQRINPDIPNWFKLKTNAKIVPTNKRYGRW